MKKYEIDGRLYADMLMGGAAELYEHITELNALNVFPVADGDTGTNMYSTVRGGISAIEDVPSNLGDLLAIFARSALLSARGNSGVILSQIFSGINEYLKTCDSASVANIADAYINGVKTSYASVQNPTEGTILTVFRESTEYAAANINADSTVEDFFRLHVEQARRSLAKTPQLLPALAEAEVVDSGAAGYLYIAEGMYGALIGEVKRDMTSLTERKSDNVDIDRFTRDSRLEFGYCTEFLLRLTTAKVDPDTFDINTVLSDLAELGGESVVAYKQEDIIKVHVHTFTPGDILSRMQQYGEFLTLKIENMSLGHSERVSPARLKKKYAVVTVACGDGLTALFTDMGADRVITGGQTANPSTAEFVDAFDKCNAEHIIVLPNNKNILLAARQAAELYERVPIHVVETKNLMQGYAALSVLNPGISDTEALISGAEAAAEGVIDCEITQAVRDVTIEGRAIKKGDYIAISGGKIAASAGSAENALMEMLSNADTDLCEIITLFVGEGVSAERRVALTDKIKDTYPDLELTVYEGGQEVYDYLVAIE